MFFPLLLDWIVKSVHYITECIQTEFKFAKIGLIVIWLSISL